ncbi:hypothetical protein [Actinacidiphila sp. bgisy167]|uniref:hypothetical protein n=1 Tax=Actinacidiphila sp. bgisy167 TaxID=3413797 RepID=UPI003D70F1A8
MRTSLRRLGVLTTTLVAAVALASPAHAGYDPYDDGTNNDDETLMNTAACADQYSSEFPFHIFYNSNLGGSYRNLKYGVYDFDALRLGGSTSTAQPLKFCMLGVSSPWPGSGQKIKNNAASARNDHYKYVARVYYFSGYNGPEDVLNPYESRARFTSVYNENASFRYWVP